MDQCLSKYYQRGFASALMMSKHSSWPITFNGDHPVSISFCTLVADNTSKGTVFVIHINTNQVPLKAGVLLHSAQFTDSCPQLSHIMTYFAPPFLPPLAWSSHIKQWWPWSSHCTCRLLTFSSVLQTQHLFGILPSQWYLVSCVGKVVVYCK